MSEPPSTPFALETTFPPVIFSYCTKTEGGRGEERMWQLANHLRSHGIASFNGKQVEPGEDWMQKWLGKMPEADVCIAMLSPGYFKSGPCKEEIYCAAREGLKILPVIFETPPPMKKGYFGTSDDERERGNFVRQKLGNWLPPPEQGLFQDDFARNLDKVVEQVRRHLSTSGDADGGGGGGGGGAGGAGGSGGAGGDVAAARSRQHRNAQQTQAAASEPSYGGTTDRQEADFLKSFFGFGRQRDEAARGSGSTVQGSGGGAVPATRSPPPQLAEDERLKQAIASGDVAAIVELLRAGGTEAQKEEAAVALAKIALNNADNKVAIARAGGIEPLVALARGGTEKQKEHAADALWMLALNDDNQVAIARAGYAL